MAQSSGGYGALRWLNGVVATEVVQFRGLLGALGRFSWLWWCLEAGLVVVVVP